MWVAVTLCLQVFKLSTSFSGIQNKTYIVTVELKISPTVYTLFCELQYVPEKLLNMTNYVQIHVHIQCSRCARTNMVLNYLYMYINNWTTNPDTLNDP